jgi:hypothetical protein
MSQVEEELYEDDMRDLTLEEIDDEHFAVLNGEINNNT